MPVNEIIFEVRADEMDGGFVATSKWQALAGNLRNPAAGRRQHGLPRPWHAWDAYGKRDHLFSASSIR